MGETREMRDNKVKRVIRWFVFLLWLPMVFLAAVSPAEAAASLSLSPGSGTFGQGSSFVVAVNVNTGGDVVNAVEAALTFPADKLKANYVSHSGSAFDVSAESTVGSGVVRIAKGKLPPGVSGSRKVASVGFTALSQGTASINLSGSVLRESDSVNIMGGTSGASFEITAGAPVVQGQSPRPESSPVPDTQAPQISDIQVLNLGMQTATIVWKTDEAADSQVEYGFSENRQSAETYYFFTAESSERVTEHKLELDPKHLIAGYLYHFKVASTDEAGNQSQSADMVFILPGYSLEVMVTDQDSKVVVGAKVRVVNIGVEAITDENGLARFTDLPVGNFSVIGEDGDAFKEVVANLVADDNKLTLVLDQRVASKGFEKVLILGLGLVVVLVVVTLGFVFWRKRMGFGNNKTSS